MNLLKDLYKGLVQSANKASSRKSSKGQRPKKNKKKEEKSTPRSKGDERRASLQTARQNNTKRATEKKSETKQKSSTSVTQRKTGSGAIRPVGKAGVMGGNTSSNKDNKSKITVNGKPIGPATKAGVMGSSSSGKNPVKKKETKGFAVNGKTVRTFTKAGVIGGNKQGDKDLAEWKAQQKKNQGIKKNALGVEAKTNTGTWGNPVGESIVKAASHASTRARTYTGAMDYAKKSTDKEIKKAEKKYGYKFSEQEKKELRQDAFEDTREQLRSRETQREINKEANKLAKDSGVKGGTYKAEELTSEDIIQAQNAYRLGGKYGQKMLGKELSKKLGSNIAYNTNKNTAARVTAGVLQGLSYGDTIHGGPATYGKEEKKAIKEATESGAYLAGYGAGIMGSFVTSGVGGVGKAIAQLGTKGAVKGATKATAKSAAKKFAQNRAGELAAETPLNALDAVKMSRDENGNIDKKEALKWMGFNTALTGGMGAAIEGAGMKLTKKQARKYIQLATKQKAGTLTKEEGELFNKLQAKLSRKAEDIQAAASNTADKGLQDVKKLKVDSKGKVVSVDETSVKALTPKERKDLQTLRAQEQAGTITPEGSFRLKSLNGRVKAIQETVRNNAEAVVRYSGKKGAKFDRETIENAVKHFESTGEAGKLKKAQKILDDDIKAATKNAEDTLDAIKASGSTSGTKYDFAPDDTFSNSEKGWISHIDPETGEKEVLIKRGASDVAQAIIGKETGSAIKNSGAKRFNYLGNYLRDVARNKGELNDIVQQVKHDNPGIEKKELNEELTYELLGRYFFNGDNAVVVELAKKDPLLARRIGEYAARLSGVMPSGGIGDILSSMSEDLTKALDEATPDKSFAEQVDDLKHTITDSEKNESSINIDNVSMADKNVAQEYIDSTDTGLLAFVKKILSFDNKSVVSKFDYSLGSVDDAAAKEILDKINIDVYGRKHNVNGAAIRHIKKRHGGTAFFKKAADDTMKVDSDIARIGYVIKNYDDIEGVPIEQLDEDTRKLAYAWQNTDKSHANAIVYSKKVDGIYYVVEAVQDAKTNKLQVVAAYMEKNKNSAATGTNGSSAQHLTPEASDASTVKQSLTHNNGPRKPSAAESRIVQRYDDAINKVDSGDVDDNILRDIEVTRSGDTWREMTTGDELSPQQVKDRIANWRDLEAKTQARIDNDPRYAPFRELDDLDAEYKALEKEEFTPEVEKRADEITSRIDEISDELGGNVQTKRSQALNEIRSDIWQEQYGGGKIPKSVTKADSDDALKAIEAQRASDETLVKNNEDVIKNSDDAEAGLERPIPDSGEMPKGLKRNVKAARPIKDQVQKQLASDGYAFTKAEKKEIDDAVETMSRRIANGDEAGAKADAEELVEKHFHFDAEEKEIDPNFKEKRRELRDIQQFLRSHAWDMPPGSARTLKEFLEFIGLPKSETRRLPIRKWSKKDSTLGKKGASRAVIDKGGKLPRAQIDDAWTSMSERWPEYFPPETEGVESRFIKMAEAAQRNAIDDFPEERIVNTLSDAEIKEWKEAKVDEVLDLARKNAGTFRGVDEPKPIKPIDGLDAGQIEKRINNEKIHLENAIKKHGKDSPRVKEIEDWLSNAEKTLDEMRGETKVKPKEASAPKPKEGATEKAGAKATKSELPKGKPVGYDEVEFDVAKMGIKDDAEVAASKEKSAQEGGPNGPKEPVKSVVGEDGVDSNFAKWFKDTFTSFRRLTESSLVGFERLAAKTGNKELRHQTTQAYLAKNRIASWIEGERAGFDRKTNGDGLNAIFEKSKLFGKKNKERRADFSNYLLYKHAIDRLKVDKPVHMAEGGGSKFTQEEYETLIKQLEDKYPAPKDGGKSELEVFADDVKAYFDDLMKYRVDAGLVSREFAETMAEKYPNYVPTYREGDEWIDILTEGESYRAGIGQSVKTAKGGSEAIEDLYQQMARITKNTIRDAEENALMNAYAKALGIKPEVLPDKASLNDIADCAIKASEQGSGGWRVTFWDNGQPVTMGVNKQVAKGLREFNGQTFTRLISTSSKLNRFGVAYKRLITDWNLIFGVRNGARDIQQAAVNSKDSVYFAKSIPSAWAAIASPKNNPYMRLYKANGGMYSALVQQGKDVAEPGTKNLFSKGIDNSIGHAIKAIEKTNGAIEIAPRLAEFIGTINKHANKELEKRGSSVAKLREEVMLDMFPKKKAADLTADELEKVENNLANKLVDIVGKDVIDRAMHNSADITLNFSRNGVIGKALNSGLVPYLNPSIQGLSKTFRLFSEGKGDKTLLNIAMKIGTLTIAPAVFNEVVLKDDKAYQSLNTRDKDTNFFIPIGDGKFIKIPKPRENAVLAEPVEYGLRYFFDKAHVGVIEEGEYSGWKDLGQMWKSAVDNIGPVNPLTDNLFSPLLHTAQNKTWYGGSIEDTSDVLGLADKSIKHSDVYNESTSAIAKEIGSTKIGGKKISDIMHLSPKKIDNLMDSYLGIIYDLGISQTSDASHGNPFLNQFVKDSVFSNKNGTELWAEFDKANAPDTMAGKLKQKAKKAVLGNTKWTIQDKSIKAQDWLNLKGYDDITYSDARNKILYDKDLTPKQKEVYDRKVKKWQNDMRHELVYGKKEVTPEMDPIRKISGLVGVDKAMKDYTYTYVDPETGEKKNQHLDAWKAYKKSDEYKKDPKKADGKFIDFYSKMRWTNGRIGENKSYPSWMTASVLAATEKGKNDDLARAYIRVPSSWNDPEGSTEKIIQRGKNYRDYGFTQDYYRNSQRTVFKAGRALDYEYTNKMNPWDKAMALATSKKKYADGAYYSADTDGKVSRRMNYARYLNKTDHTTKEIYDFADKYDLKLPKFDYDKTTSKERGEGWRAFNKKVETAVNEAYKDAPDAVKAAVYHVITDDTYTKPFGDIPDMTQKNDTGITDLDARENKGYGGRRGRRRRGRRGRGGGGGSGGGGTMPTTASGAIKASVTDAKVKEKGRVTNPFKGKISDVSTKSNLDDAYRKKVRQLRNQSRKKH